MREGRLFVLSGPSGAGKGTVLKAALSRLDGAAYSVSYTTREKTKEDADGVTYFFVDKNTFVNMIKEGRFLEWAEVHGNYYGTSREVVEKALRDGFDVILEIDVQGALQVKDKLPDAVTVFIAPPSAEELARRIKNRRRDSDEQIAVRLKNAETEMKLAEKYEYIIVNETVDVAAQEFIDIVNKYREG